MRRHALRERRVGATRDDQRPDDSRVHRQLQIVGEIVASRTGSCKPPADGSVTAADAVTRYFGYRAGTERHLQQPHTRCLGGRPPARRRKLKAEN